MKRLSLTLLLGVIAIPLSSCANLYFETLAPPRHPVKIDSLRALANKEWWYGIVFNGEKVGFSRLSLLSRPEREAYLLQGEMCLTLRFLGLKRHVKIEAEDTIGEDLTLKSFRYFQKIDESELEMTGRKEGECIYLNTKGPGWEKDSKLSAKGRVYPASIINLYPVVHGLAVGKEYRYSVFEPQTVHLYEVEQKVTGYEKAPRLGLAPSFRIETEMEGFSATTWINTSGETEMEWGAAGILITYRETEKEARKYLVEASLAKKDLGYDFSLIKTDRPITCPRQVKNLTLSVSGMGGLIKLPQGPTQQVIEEKDKDRLVIRTNIKMPSAEGDLSDNVRALYLSSHPQIEVHHPEIKRVAWEITKHMGDEREKLVALTHWVSKEITHELTDSFSALEVLKKKKGECQAHTLLFTALARSLGIPTRLVGGLVYVEGQGFLYHSWAESYVQGWIPVDPTFGQVPVDATHIKLVEGPDWSSFLPLSKVMGKIKIHVQDYACDEQR
ncbi:MAG: transglutaminase-like domain-containing protein [Syntrophales bacterium]|nr:transglutaminase-like domain-containing protein [Syntrophales bacterium]